MSVRLVFDPAKSAQLHRALTLLPRRVAIRHLRIGLNAWGGVVKPKAVSLARVETSTLKKSLRVKVTIPDASFNVQHHGKPAYVIVGPGRKTGRMVRRKNLKGHSKAQKALQALRKRLGESPGISPLARDRAAVGLTLNQFSDAVYRNPTRYAHLVERRYPFMAPAQAAGETTGLEKLRQKIEQGIAQEVAALAK